jgi:Chalcone isomerase-like
MVRNSGVPIATLRSRLDLLERALPALEKGDRLDFTYLPGVGTVVRGQGRELKVPGKDFAEALFSVWLGPHADSSALQDKLLGVN